MYSLPTIPLSCWRSMEGVHEQYSRTTCKHRGQDSHYGSGTQASPLLAVNCQCDLVCRGCFDGAGNTLVCATDNWQRHQNGYYGLLLAAAQCDLGLLQRPAGGSAGL